jgi:hypothetical protein
MRTPPALLAALAGCALVLGACTSSSSKSSAGDFQGPQRVVAQTIEDFQKAGSRRDANKVCEDFLAPALIRTIETASRTTCANALDDRLDDADSFGLTVEKVAISGDTATAQVKSDTGDTDRVDTFRLVRVGRNWKLSQLGAG